MVGSLRKSETLTPVKEQTKHTFQDARFSPLFLKSVAYLDRGCTPKVKPDSFRGQETYSCLLTVLILDKLKEQVVECNSS